MTQSVLTYPQPPPQPTAPVWQLPLVADEVFEETIGETDMAEERSVMPPPFTGESEDASDWARHFYKYCVYKEYDDRKALPLFKVLMVGPAASSLLLNRFRVSKFFNRINGVN